MKRIAFLSLSLVLATSACAAAYEQDVWFSRGYESQERHTNQHVAQNEQFREIANLSAEPIFQNVPFLKLRAGDQLVRAQIYRQPIGKGVAAEAAFEWTKPRLYLKREGKLLPLYAMEKAGRLIQPSSEQVPLFRWESTRANADALFQICRPKPSLSLAQLTRLDTALQGDFAEYLGERLRTTLDQPEKVSTGFQYLQGDDGVTSYVYSGFAYDNDTRETYLYDLILGPDEWREERAILITAPPKPDRPSASQQMSSRPNQDFLMPLGPLGRRRLETQIANSKKFDAIIQRVIESKAP